MPSTYDYRLIQAGMKIEIIEYEKPVIVFDKLDKNRNSENRIRIAHNKSEGCKVSASALDKKKNRQIVLYRARNEVRRLINANVNRYSDEMCNVYKPVFLTLTFADNIQDITAANKELRKFMKRLGNYIAKWIKPMYNMWPFQNSIKGERYTTILSFSIYLSLKPKSWRISGVMASYKSNLLMKLTI